MPAVGIDFGNENCYIAVARAGGIETIANDYSQRATPSYVGFNATSRDLGTAAKNKFVTNLKNSVCSFKRLIGKKFRDQALSFELSYLPYAVHELPNGSVSVKVSYLGRETIFTIPQITAMLMTKLKDIAEVGLGTNITDCVVSVPIYYSDAARRTMLDICKIAGLNVLRLLNDTTAVALAYGFYKQDLSEDKPKKVVFVDIGHSALQASVVDFYKGRLKVLSSTWDPLLGGRDIDNHIVRYFSEEFKEKYKLDVLSNNRAIVRLIQECEKLKKQLSANPQVLPLNIECFMEDKDVSGKLGREKLEQLIAELLKKIEFTLQNLLHECNLTYSDIDSVEITGGTTRIPAIKEIIKKVFHLVPSTTLNLDEAVARGCAIQAAMLSPSLKAREFSILDVQPFSIKLMWSISNLERGDVEVFPRNHPVPFSKKLTFFRKEDFTLEAHYAGSSEKNLLLIGYFHIKNVNQVSPSGESSKIIIKLRMNMHGIFNIVSATIVDKDYKDNEPLDQKSEDLIDRNLKKDDAPLLEQPEKKRDFFSLKKPKKTTQGIELIVEPKVPQLSESELKTFRESEERMIQQDKSEEKRINAKNSVEEYVYEMRGRFSDELKHFCDDQERDDILHKLNSTENWIYEEGQDENEMIYKEKLADLKTMTDPVLRRKYEHDQRGGVLSEFQAIIDEVHKILNAYLIGESQYSNVDPKDMEEIQRVVDENNKWLQQLLENLKKLKPHENPPISAEEIYLKKEHLRQFINSELCKSQSQSQSTQENHVPPSSEDECKC